MLRVARALETYAPPEISITARAEAADLVVLHTIGTDTWPIAKALLEAGKSYAVMQYCLRSTQAPDTGRWLSFWANAAAVWTYYDLPEAMAEDGIEADGLPFYHAPLGAEPEIFYPTITALQRYGILTSGYVAESECIAEATEAAARAGRQVFHLGPPMDCHGPHVTQRLGISDGALQAAYARSDYVAGLRRCEGFEMPAAEGLLCGARPLMLDRPHYRAWFEPWATFVPEADYETTTAAIAAVLEEGPRPLTDEEIEAATERFNWQPLVAGFWRRILEGTRG